MTNFIAFDVETTGIVVGVDQIIEIGAAKFIDGEVDSTFVTLIDPKRPVPPAASAVNGITDEMLRGKPLIEDILDPFAEFCGELPMVAHNAPFDSQFIEKAIKQHETLSPRGVVLDTLSISRKIYPGLANYKLGTLIQYLKIEHSKFHRAEADSVYCGQLFLKLLERIFISSTAFDMDRLINLTGKPRYSFPKIQKLPKQMDLFSYMEQMKDLS